MIKFSITLNTLTYDVTELPKTDDEIKVENVYINGKKVRAIHIGSAITDENGIATITYESTGAGEVNIFATCGNLVSNTITIMDKPEDFSAIITVDWLDNGNRDGNRPDSIDITLYKDDVEITVVTLSESHDWIYDLSALELPKYENGEAINYSIRCDRTTGYNTIVEDFHIIQEYNPPVTSASIQISWQDNNDATGKRSVSIIATLSNGATVKLNTSNNWFATVPNLPAMINKKTVSYSWVDPDIYGYKINGKGYSGKTTYYFMALK